MQDRRLSTLIDSGVVTRLQASPSGIEDFAYRQIWLLTSTMEPRGPGRVNHTTQLSPLAPLIILRPLQVCGGPLFHCGMVTRLC
jgi:hypothetical protein